jgi:hypothetical protein
MIPEDSRKKLEQLRQQAMARSALEAQYKAEMAGKYTKDMPSFYEWLKQRNTPGMAGGGKVKAPKSTVKAYKLFRVDPKQPGKLFPLFVDANTPVQMGEWVDAIEGSMANGKVKSKIGPLAYRPGWHAGDLPIATHIGEKSDPSLTAPDTRPANHAWAEVEMPNDVDWQSVANERGMNAQGKLIPVKAHITDQIPKGGHYRYKTNSNMTGNWLIGGSMKVNRVLSDAEVAKINKAAGLADLPRAQPFKKKAFGFAGGGAVGPQEWMAEEHVNHKADGGIAHMAGGGSVMGINVASDRKSDRRYADMIVDGHKTLESRNSDTLRPYVGKRVAIVRTGEGKAKAIGEVTIGEPMVVDRKRFRSLEDKHHVPEGSAFDISTPTKHLYPLHDPVRYDEERDVEHGIVSRKVIGKADGGTIKLPANPSLDTMKLALTKNKIGMHSPLEKSLINVPRTKGTAQEFMTEASKQPGFKKEEVDDRRLELPQGKLTKEQFLAHLRSNKGPQIQTKVLQDEGPFWEDAIDRAMGYEGPADEEDDGTHYMNLQEIAREEVPKTSYSEYTHPGGQNYREVLLTVPQQTDAIDTHRNFLVKMQMKYPGSISERINAMTPEEIAEQERLGQKANTQRTAAQYRSSHWDEPNVLAHLRMSDRTGPNGEKILHVEEIQSDWHQEGRKRGYASGPDLTLDERSEWRDFAVNGTSTPEEEQRFNDLDSRATKGYGVPDAPHKKSWHELALKHALTEAAKGGYHGIAITPGEQQADRYDLSKQIGYLGYKPEEGRLVAHDHNRREVMNQTGIEPEDIEDHIGKEAASRLLATNPVAGMHLLEGENIKVGGEGMKGFYDKIVPDYLNKLGKKHGAQVMPMGIPQQWKHNDEKVVANLIAEGIDPEDLSSNQFADARDRLKGVEPPPHKVHYFPIPDTMRQQIKTEGLPQYRVGGDV